MTIHCYFKEVVTGLFLTFMLQHAISQGCVNRKHVYICDDPGTSSISCPSRATISIAYANYGRTELDAIRCPHGQLHNNVITCFNVITTQPEVKSMCDKKNTCAFNTSLDAYASPDPCPGTYKYLDVEFDCLDPESKCAVFCGGDHTLSSTDSVTFNSPNYPSIYPNFLGCQWTFTASQPGYIIKLEFLALSIEGGCADYIYLFDTYNGNDTRICLEYLNKLGPFLSTGNQMRALFYTDSFVGFTGFSAKVTAIPKPLCTTTQLSLNQSGTSVTSPFYPDNYPSLYDCQWHFTTQPLFYIFIKFFDLDLENYCNNDYILIVDNNSGSSNKYCGSSTPNQTVVYQSTSVYLFFKTSYLDTGRGFNITVNTNIDFNECTYPGDNICDDDINNLATCVNTIGSYSCVCLYTDRGLYWDGSKCTTGNVPDTMCKLQNGLCEQNCTSHNLEGTVVSPVLNYTCSCTEGYQLLADGRSCGDINECGIPSTCNSTAIPAPVCVNNIGSYSCSCPTGYLWNMTSHECRDADECDIENGGCDHICHNVGDTATCSCQQGFLLLRNSKSCQDMDECKTNNGICQQVCENSQGSYKCSCLTGYQLNTTDNHTCDNQNECTTANGGCHQICEDTSGGFVCKCHSGYTLAVDERTCADVDECKGTQSCQQICTNNPGSYTCSCDLGYTLDSNNQTCSDVNECDLNLSGCAQQCSNTVGSYQCNCITGYVLLPDKKNCADENECVNIHGCEYKCVNFQGSFQCICNTGYVINEADNKTCLDANECDVYNGYCQESCNNTNGGHFCSCPNGYVLRADGRTCRDIDECSGNHPCQHECVNTMGSYKCVCRVGYTLASGTFNCTDTNECATFNGGCAHTCANSGGSYTCGCRQGYLLNIDGKTCLDNDECNITSSCDQLCINQPGKYRCTCDTGYTLNANFKTCADINECTDKTSGCAQNCENILGTFNCSCNQGYRLSPDKRNCDDVNECSENVDKCDHTCDNTFGSYKCACQQGSQLQSDGKSCIDVNECDVNNGFCQQLCNNTVGGHNCDCFKGYGLNIDKRTCADLDECSSSSLNSCEQKCINMIGSYKCECNAGYILQNDGLTCVDIDECSSEISGCAHNCTNTPGSYQCLCHTGYLLLPDQKNCVDRNECKSSGGNFCQHTCENDAGGYKCACFKGYTLHSDKYTCTDEDECSRSNPPCEHNCTNNIGSFTCHCREGFTLLRDATSCQDINECVSNNNPCSYLCINDLGSFNCICPLQYYLHPDEFRCMGPYLYTVILTLDIMYDVTMTNPKSTSFTSVENSIKANVLGFMDNPVEIGLENVFMVAIDNMRGNSMATIQLQFSKPLENTNLSIIIYKLHSAIVVRSNVLQINGQSTRVIATMQYLHKFNNGSTKQWDVLSLCHLHDNIFLCQANSKCLESNAVPTCSCIKGYETDANQQCDEISGGLTTTYIVIIGTLTGAALIGIIIAMTWICSRIIYKPRVKHDSFIRNNRNNLSNHSYASTVHGEFELAKRQEQAQRAERYELPHDRHSFRARTRQRDANYSGLQWHYWY